MLRFLSGRKPVEVATYSSVYEVITELQEPDKREIEIAGFGRYIATHTYNPSSANFHLRSVLDQNIGIHLCMDNGQYSGAFYSRYDTSKLNDPLFRGQFRPYLNEIMKHWINNRVYGFSFEGTWFRHPKKSLSVNYYSFCDYTLRYQDPIGAVHKTWTANWLSTCPIPMTNVDSVYFVLEGSVTMPVVVCRQLAQPIHFSKELMNSVKYIQAVFVQ